MRLFLAVLGCLAFMANEVARAEEPEEIPIEGSHQIGVGESKSLRFSSTLKTVTVTSVGIVEATAQTDRVITVTGVMAGVTTLLVYGDDGRRIYSALISVNPDTGHVVRLYGNARSDSGGGTKDYVGFYCNSVFCGRSDKDLPPASSTQTTTTTSRQMPDGSQVQRTINNR